MEGNISTHVDWAYGVEALFHEQLLQSSHRTLNPEEADFFYAPVYASCYLHPVYGWADMPFWHGPGGKRLASQLHAWPRYHPVITLLALGP